MDTAMDNALKTMFNELRKELREDMLTALASKRLRSKRPAEAAAAAAASTEEEAKSEVKNEVVKNEVVKNEAVIKIDPVFHQRYEEKFRENQEEELLAEQYDKMSKEIRQFLRTKYLSKPQVGALTKMQKITIMQCEMNEMHADEVNAEVNAAVDAPAPAVDDVEIMDSQHELLPIGTLPIGTQIGTQIALTESESDDERQPISKVPPTTPCSKRTRGSGSKRTREVEAVKETVKETVKEDDDLPPAKKPALIQDMRAPTLFKIDWEKIVCK